MALSIVPITLAEANAYIALHHRHNKPTAGCRFVMGCANAGSLVGVCIVGRPVSRLLDDGHTAEINRVCTDGTKNACSMLYGAARRAARALGYDRIITYTLPEEGGRSLHAAGFHFKGDAGNSSTQWHNRPGRSVQPIGDDLVGGKWLWMA